MQNNIKDTENVQVIRVLRVDTTVQPTKTFIWGTIGREKTCFSCFTRTLCYKIGLKDAKMALKILKTWK